MSFCRNYEALRINYVEMIRNPYLQESTIGSFLKVCQKMFQKRYTKI